jgi:hypothetical protein
MSSDSSINQRLRTRSQAISLIQALYPISSTVINTKPPFHVEERLGFFQRLGIKLDKLFSRK